MHALVIECAVLFFFCALCGGQGEGEEGGEAGEGIGEGKGDSRGQDRVKEAQALTVTHAAGAGLWHGVAMAVAEGVLTEARSSTRAVEIPTSVLWYYHTALMEHRVACFLV